MVRATDGTLWSGWTPFSVNAPLDNAPVVSAANYTATLNQSIAATSLFSVSDADGDPITAYQLQDATANPTSGAWIVGGVTQPASQTIDRRRATARARRTWLDPPHTNWMVSR